MAAVVGATAIVVADRHGPPFDWSGEDGLQLLARVRALNPGAVVIVPAPRSWPSSSGPCSNKAPTGDGCSPPPPKRCEAPWWR